MKVHLDPFIPSLTSLPIVHKSAMTPLRRRRFQFQLRLPYPLPALQGLLSTFFFMAASLVVLRLLRLVEGFWSSVAAIVSIRLLYDLVAGGHGTPIHVLGK